jgi:hypothetical protein
MSRSPAGPAGLGNVWPPAALLVVEAASVDDPASQIRAGRLSGDGRRWTPSRGPGGACLGRSATETESVPIGMEGGSKVKFATSCAGVFF